MHRRTGLLLAVFFSVTGAYSADPSDKPLSEYHLESWTHDDGLPGSNINALLQTRDGYIWIGTDNGLSRFDGIRFVTINRKSHPKLLSNRIRALFEDRNRNLWIGTEGGGISTLSRGTMTTRTSKDGISSDYVRAITEDNAGNLWIGTDGEGLCRLSGDSVTLYGKENSIIDERITSVLAASHNAIWVGTFNGLFRFSDGEWSRFGRHDGLSSDTIICMWSLDEEIWFGTYGGGLSVLRNGRFSIPDSHADLAGATVTSLAGNQEVGLFAATLLGGIHRIRGTIVSSRRVASHDRGEYATAILSDREGSIWIGLQDGRLLRLRDATFTWFPSMAGAQPDPVRSVFEDNEGALWIGTASSLRRFDGDSLVPYASDKGRPINILSVGQDGSGTIWAGTLGNGLRKLVGRSFSDASIVPMPAIWALHSDVSGTLWAGSNGGLISVSNGNPRIYEHNKNKLSHNDVRAICRTADGSLWVGTSYGLNKMVGDTFMTYTKNNSAISNDVVISLYPDASGDLWVGTIGGLNRFRNQAFTSFTMVDGLPGDAVGMILEDNAGRFWLGGEQGLFTIEKENLNRYAEGQDSALHYISFGKADGLLDPGFSGSIQPASWKSRDGRVWFATNGGVAMADPKYLRLNTAPPTLVIEQIVVDQNTINIDPLPPLPHTINQIEISYTAPSFVKPEKVQFKYRLRGLDDDWIEAGGRRTAYFTHVPPGEYVFEAMGANELGIWSLQAATLPLTILPPFWMTWWFQTVFALAFLSIGPAIYFRRVTQLKRRHAQQQEFSMRLIASQEAERKRIAAELHDSLGQNIIIIKNRALLGRQAGDDKETISEQLEEITKTAAATLDEMRKIAHNLRPLNLERFGLKETIVQTVKDVGAATGIPIESSIDNMDKLIVPEMEIHLFRIVQEALNNIVKHSHATAGSVSINVVDGVIRLSIRDNGRGFDTALGASRTGFGLVDIAERVRLIGGNLTVDSIPGKGTSMTVTLPLPETRS